ncbi:MAG TPA: type II toxin-antitoxin system HicA family toxin [Anaerolineae bacterium]|nr:type II toxin-antitoxin system HicA family toxin [Anaerolineae bacterium]HQH39309.1 type II toxin-antitoxin system HicA family toxin [Anaerolineae bacterium]
MKYRELAKRLRQLGCEFVRTASGSHRIWWNPANGQYTTIPDWSSKDLKVGTLRSILSDLGLAMDEILTKR